MQVNADVRLYTVHEDGSQSLSRVLTRHVGKSISTKAVLGSEREDVTNDYKFPERSVSERAALLGELIQKTVFHAVLVQNSVNFNI